MIKKIKYMKRGNHFNVIDGPKCPSWGTPLDFKMKRANKEMK